MKGGKLWAQPYFLQDPCDCLLIDVFDSFEGIYILELGSLQSSPDGPFIVMLVLCYMRIGVLPIYLTTSKPTPTHPKTTKDFVAGCH